jgi:hypothetical protein
MQRPMIALAYQAARRTWCFCTSIYLEPCLGLVEMAVGGQVGQERPMHRQAIIIYLYVNEIEERELCQQWRGESY